MSAEFLKTLIRDVSDFPKSGILFRDITPLLNDAKGFSTAIEDLEILAKKMQVDRIAGIEARGFILAAALAVKMNLPFIPIRKPGKLPWKCERREYDLEYGKDGLELHVDAVNPGERILIVDDVLATGGTLRAACELVSALGAVKIFTLTLIELKVLEGRKRLGEYSYQTVISY